MTITHLPTQITGTPLTGQVSQSAQWAVSGPTSILVGGFGLMVPDHYSLSMQVTSG